MNAIDKKIRQLEKEIDERLSFDLPIVQLEHELEMLTNERKRGKAPRSQCEAYGKHYPEKIMPMYEAEAKERQGTRTDLKTDNITEKIPESEACGAVPQKSAKPPLDTRKELAATAFHQLLSNLVHV